MGRLHTYVIVRERERHPDHAGQDCYCTCRKSIMDSKVLVTCSSRQINLMFWLVLILTLSLEYWLYFSCTMNGWIFWLVFIESLIKLVFLASKRSMYKIYLPSFNCPLGFCCWNCTSKSTSKQCFGLFYNLTTQTNYLAIYVITSEQTDDFSPIHTHHIAPELYSWVAYQASVEACCEGLSWLTTISCAQETKSGTCIYIYIYIRTSIQLH